MNGFWPTLPIYVPDSPGTPLWWDLFWWGFQVVVMTSVLFMLRHWAVKVDREMDVTLTDGARATDASQSGPGMPT